MMGNHQKGVASWERKRPERTFWKEGSVLYSDRGLCYTGISICQNSMADFQDLCVSLYVNFICKTVSTKLFRGRLD